MRVRDLIRRFRGDQDRSAGIIAGQAVKIRDLESKLENTEAAIAKLMRAGSGGTDLQVDFLKKELAKKARLIDQLRAGVVVDAQTAALRHDRNQAMARARGLEQQLAMLQAANDGISAAEAVAA
ncbi:hypothetical protein ACFWIB_15465 [Streptomyces sp. NPDC127051]|uniref:hypothetical protein n=1 Tax=Streptomyces sp. NPDC127051 TaxID=3347119 RepID=UPI003653D4A1